ncbi:unnamed protein product [Psylliodes chrysocephalus]|uniref:Uncharacterized protein n=1 Tax=Psylliodes chrysocephalus TaxID=3402493 RepID=A0A9P0D3J1_9CUCU|nr:unnamed protein product [Psylliodes chrysocephala]
MNFGSSSVAVSLYSRAHTGRSSNSPDGFRPSGTASAEEAESDQEMGLENVKVDASPVLIIHDDNGISEETRNILGPDPSKKKKCGFNLHAAVEPIWSHILAFGFSSEEKDRLFKKYEMPENCKLLTPPIINPEISASMNALHTARDDTHLNYQNQIGKVLATLGRAINVILEEETSIPKQVKENLLAYTADSGRMLCTIVNEMSNKRR